jgi:hypothetical protein
MILDKELQFSDSVALSASANSGVLSLGSASRLFEGEPMIVLINVEVAADAGNGDETYAFALQSDDVLAFSSPVELASRSIPRAELVAGSKHTIAVPVEKNQEGFLRLAYTLGGTTPSITLSAHLVPQSFVDKGSVGNYPDNSVIS